MNAKGNEWTKCWKFKDRKKKKIFFKTINRLQVSKQWSLALWKSRHKSYCKSSSSVFDLGWLFYLHFYCYFDLLHLFVCIFFFFELEATGEDTFSLRICERTHKKRLKLHTVIRARRRKLVAGAIWHQHVCWWYGVHI